LPSPITNFSSSCDAVTIVISFGIFSKLVSVEESVIVVEVAVAAVEA